jgi:hypothetical protein
MMQLLGAESIGSCVDTHESMGKSRDVRSNIKELGEDLNALGSVLNNDQALR